MASISASVRSIVVRPIPDNPTLVLGAAITNLTPSSPSARARVFRQQLSISNNPDVPRYVDPQGNTASPNDPDAPRRFERLIPPETTGVLSVED